MIEAAARGELDVLFSAGGNFLEVLPDPDWVRGALARIPLRVHMDIVLSPQMFVEPARGGAAAARDDALRDSRGRDRDLDRAPDHLQPRDPGSADRRGALGVRRPRRAGRAGAAGAGRARPVCRHAARSAPRSTPSSSSTRGIEELAEEGDSLPVRRPDAVRGLGLSDARRQGALQSPQDRRARRRRRPARALHPPGQAVQLDGPGEGRQDHRRSRATPSSSALPTPKRLGIADGDRRADRVRSRRACALARSSPRSPPATSRSTGRRATC